MFQFLRILIFLVAFTAASTHSLAQREQTQNQEQGWVQVPSGTNTSFLGSISVTPSKTIWMGGSEVILKSSDLGLTWNPVLNHRGLVEFVDDSNGMIARGDDTILVTTNGGVYWEQRTSIPTNSLFGFTYVRRDTAFALGNGTVIRTTDQGRTWKAEDLGGHPASIHFLDSKIGVIGCRSVAGFSLVFRTTDGGDRWTRHETSAHDWYAVEALSRDSVVLAGSSYVALTTNGGQDWLDTLVTEPGWGLSALDFRGREGWGVGGRSNIRYTNDARTWTPQLTPTTTTLYDVEIVDDSIVLASGEKGVILRTSNKGKSWVQVYPTLTTIPSQTFPEPMNQTGTLRYSIPEAGLVTITIHSLEGNVQSHVYRGHQELGTHEIALDASSWASGVYLYNIESTGKQAQGRITVVR